MLTPIILAVEGGLFNLDATLPVMAIQFLILVAVLNAIFFKPVTQAVDGRQDFIRTSLADAQAKTKEAEALAQQYQEAIGQARLKVQQTIAEAEASAAKVRAQKLAEVQVEVKAKLDAARILVEQEKAQALQTLQQQVAVLSQQITHKILGAAANG